VGSEDGGARYWGFWTRGKLDLLRRYLNAFTTTTKNKASERLYLDLFGGQPQNRERITEADLDGSARIALAIGDPPFTRLRVFELEPYASRLREVLRADYPGRDAQVVAGDCNQTIARALAELRRYNWAPTCAVVDPNGPDIHWSTLETLAKFKKRTAKTKVEIWMLLAAGMFMRNLPTSGAATEGSRRTLTAMYGTDQWTAIYDARVAGHLTGRQAREEYVNLMRWRLQNVLGYRWTHPLEIFNERGVPIYHMIFATDHQAGDRIMTNLYNQAANEFPAMRHQARVLRAGLIEQAQGIQTLFDMPSAAPVGDERLYEHVPPWAPYGTATDK
jgi:three-Cys-motif partner protein